jgi:5-methyltetrahydropteroyltriglutamate--homocysteine methyltransferase
MQEKAGIDIVTDGEQTRRHFVNGYMEKLEGIDFKNLKTMRIRNRYDAERAPRRGPGVASRPGAFRRRALPARGDLEEGQVHAARPDDDGRYALRRALRAAARSSAMAFAAILNQEARELAALGVDVIQFDEPAFNVYFDEVRDWGIAALEAARAGLTCKTAVHICYGYGIEANIVWKKSLGNEWRQYEQTFPLLAQSSIDQVSLECANSRVPIELIALLKGKDVLVGSIDVATRRVETPEEVAAVIREALKYVPKERLYPCTNCGMVPLPREVAAGKLAALGAGAALVRRELV